MPKAESIAAVSSSTWCALTQRSPPRGVFDCSLIEERPGFALLHIVGDEAPTLFVNEPGGHRWQGQSGGRVHTSTVTVAVLNPEAGTSNLNPRDVEITTTKGSGPGGQHRNKTESCVIATHKPSGLSVRIDMRSQYEGRRIALSVLAARLSEAESAKASATRAADRRAQVGSGMRGDKVRTYREQDDQVNDHRTGRTWRLSRWRKGDWD